MLLLEAFIMQKCKFKHPPKQMQIIFNLLQGIMAMLTKVKKFLKCRKFNVILKNTRKKCI